MQKKRSLQNALNEEPLSGRKKEQTENDADQKVLSREDVENLPDQDIIGVTLRGVTAIFMAIFFGAVISGLLEASQGWEITFGSLPMIAITSVLYYPSYKILTRMGFFRKNSE